MDARSRGELERKARRLELLVQDVEALEDQGARSSAVAAIQALLELHGDALERIAELVGPEAAERLAADEIVGGLLLLHGLHPLPVEDRVRRALETVRPYLRSHGGGVELLGIREGVVRLRLEGSCHGCPSSAATLEHAIQQAIVEGAPDVAGIEVEGVVQPPPRPAFVPLGSIQSPGPRAAWHTVGGLEDLGPGAVSGRDVAGVPIALCRSGDDRYAYRDRCPGCGAGLDGAPVAAGALACPGCRRRYDVRRAGRCLDDEALHLDPVPLLADGGGVRVAVPEPALRV